MSAPTHAPTVAVTRDEGVMLWVITFGTIVLWIVHVGVEISLAGYRRGHPSVPWVMNGLTLVLASAAGLATVASYRIVDRHREHESHASSDGRVSFVGWMGVFIGTCDVVLILVEGAYLVAIHG